MRFNSVVSLKCGTLLLRVGFFGLFFSCVVFGVKAQEISQHYADKISFFYKSTTLSQANIKKIFRLYDRLPVNTSLELNVLSPKEIKKLKYDHLVILSQKRTTAIANYLLHDRVLDQKNIETAVTPPPAPDSTSVKFDNSTVVKFPKDYGIHTIVLRK